MRKTIIITLVVVAITALGCSTAMVPVGSNSPHSKMAVDLIVGQEFPHFQRSDPYTPIHVTFRNNTPSKISLKYSYFTLIDPKGREYILAPVVEVVDWVRYDRWDSYYAPYYPNPVGKYVFREGRLRPGKQLQAVMFFHQATRFGQGIYTLRANIPANRQPIEYKFRLK